MRNFFQTSSTHIVVYYGNLDVQTVVLSLGVPISVQGVNPRRTRERLACDYYMLSARERTLLLQEIIQMGVFQFFKWGLRKSQINRTTNKSCRAYCSPYSTSHFKSPCRFHWFHLKSQIIIRHCYVILLCMGPWLSKVFRERREKEPVKQSISPSYTSWSNFLQNNCIHAVCMSTNFRGSVVSVKLKGWIILKI